MISSLFNLQLCLSYPPLGTVLSSRQISMQKAVMAVPVGEVFICQNLGPNLSEIEVRTICEYKESYSGPVAGF